MYGELVSESEFDPHYGDNKRIMSPSKIHPPFMMSTWMEGGTSIGTCAHREWSMAFRFRRALSMFSS